VTVPICSVGGKSQQEARWIPLWRLDRKRSTYCTPRAAARERVGQSSVPLQPPQPPSTNHARTGSPEISRVSRGEETCVKDRAPTQPPTSNLHFQRLPPIQPTIKGHHDQLQQISPASKLGPVAHHRLARPPPKSLSHRKNACQHPYARLSYTTRLGRPRYWLPRASEFR
jgi:hypothetical protein